MPRYAAQPDARPVYLRTGHVADILHVSPKTVSRWAKEGKLPFLKTLGNHRRYPGARDPRAGREPGGATRRGVLMDWNGKELRTIGELLDAVAAVPTREDARAFMAAYRAEIPHAGQNVGYLAGYCDPDTARRIWDWFECAHPVFGTYVPTAEEAFAAGQKLAAEGSPEC